jgi:hypothetical protein
MGKSGTFPITNSQLIKEYYASADATSYSLAAKYGVSQAVVTRRLRENISFANRKLLESEKKSAGMRRKWAGRGRGKNA